VVAGGGDDSGISKGIDVGERSVVSIARAVGVVAIEAIVADDGSLGWSDRCAEKAKGGYCSSCFNDIIEA
jgi:hypothetical protein